MEIVIINCKIKKNNKTQLYQTLESLQHSIRSHCKKFELKINQNNSLFMEFIFESHESFEKNFYNNEFNILKGTLKSLCEDVIIKVNDSPMKNS